MILATKNEKESAATILEHIRLTVGYSKQKVLTYKKRVGFFFFFFTPPHSSRTMQVLEKYWFNQLNIVLENSIFCRLCLQDAGRKEIDVRQPEKSRRKA